MLASKCESLCELDANCVYYRYENLQPSKIKNCYMMATDQCKVEGDGCEPDCSNPGCEPDCESGSPDGKCTNGNKPAGYTCPAGSTHNGEETIIPDFYLHWSCRDPHDLTGAPIDITKPGDAPGDTICTAKPE